MKKVERTDDEMMNECSLSLLFRECSHTTFGGRVVGYVTAHDRGPQ